MYNDDSMFLDTETFDFSTLDDGEASVEEKVTPAKVEAEVDDEEFEFDLEDENGEEYEDDGEEELDEDDELLADEMSKMNQDYTELGSKFDEIPDDTEFNINGMKISKGQIKEVVQLNEEVRRSREFMSAYEARIAEIEQHRVGKLAAAQWETQDLVNQFEQALQRPNLTADQYRELRLNLDAYNNKLNTIKRVSDEAASDFMKAQHQVAQNRIDATCQVMMKEYPDYQTKVGPEVFKYALDAGITAEALKASVSPELVRMMIKAKKFDDLSARSRAKATNENVSTARSTKSKASSKVKASSAKKSVSRQQAEALKRIRKNGGNAISESDNALIFDLLD